jgi:hypothetical protein
MLTLSALKAYLQDHDQVTIQQLRIHFKASYELIGERLDYFIRRGDVVEKNECLPACSKTCAGCSLEHAKVYAWVGKKVS